LNNIQNNSNKIFTDSPLVSVGIPTYNQPEGLRRTLKCITQQTYKNLEIIISDNCSPGPETENVVKEFILKDTRILFFRQDENRGVINNFKFVFEKARGEYFMWAADDDEWDSKFIRLCIDNIKDAGTIMTNYKTVFRTTNKTIINPPLNLSFNSSRFTNAEIFLKNLCPSIIYGLHKKATINFYLTDKIFDFYDCYFGLKQIINNGVVILPLYLYTAGIESEVYQIKPINPQKNKLLEYTPFFQSCFRSIIFCKNLKIIEKIYLIKTVFLITMSLYMTYEEPYHKYIIGFFKRMKKIFLLLNIFLIDLIIFIKKLKSFRPKISYSQSGEDLIIKFIFDTLQVKNPFYVDIGAHHPYEFSNTALFYKLGGRGINIEPNPDLFKLLKKYRKKDINLNIGIAAQKGEMQFYIMTSPTMNTFSKQAADDLSNNHSISIKNVINVRVDTISNISKNYIKGKKIDLLSLDVEGLDFEILKTIDFLKFFPIVICVETRSYSEKGKGVKDYEIINFLQNKGYTKYADTYINSIFVRTDLWVNN
jgi:FkbM family methyltransferase